MKSDKLQELLDAMESHVDTAGTQRNAALATGQQARMIGLLVMEIALLRELAEDALTRLGMLPYPMKGMWEEKK